MPRLQSLSNHQGHHMKPVEADGRPRQGLLHTQGVGRVHIHAYVYYRARITAMRGQILGKGDDGLVVSPRTGKQQTLGFQVMHDCDVFVPFLDAGLVDADLAYRAQGVFGTRGHDVVADARPQALGANTQLAGGLCNRRFPAQRQGQGFEQQGESTALPRPGDIDLAGIEVAPQICTAR